MTLQPLTYNQLLKYAQCDGSLEQELNVQPSSRTITPELKEALEQTILPNVADSTKNYLYSTLWTAILKAEPVIVGDLCIIGEPNAEDEIEIGYGTYDAFRGKGYMTEIVSGIIAWAKTQPQVRSITANTEKTNAASYKVLQKNQFVKSGETETMFHWKLVVKP
ncbi:MAG TPA: GNAT family N-acetyltransferase [Lacibacter sp.]|nr:GNAT family N-acetyltransferase [Lacibacter sp.]